MWDKVMFSKPCHHYTLLRRGISWSEFGFKANVGVAYERVNNIVHQAEFQPTGRRRGTKIKARNAWKDSDNKPWAGPCASCWKHRWDTNPRDTSVIIKIVLSVHALYRDARHESCRSSESTFTFVRSLFMSLVKANSNLSKLITGKTKNIPGPDGGK